MSRKGLLILVMGVVAATPTLAQTTERDADTAHRLSPSLQKKLADRLAKAPLAAGDVTGPMVDRVTRDWNLETANCSLIKSQIKFTGVKKNTLWLTTNNDGTYYFNLRREITGTATDAAGNKYLFLYDETNDLDLDRPDLTDTTKFTGSGADTLQLIPLTPTGAGYTMAEYFKVDTPTLVSNIPPPTASTGPHGCNPF